MADHTQTITNTIGAIMGPGYPQYWNAVVWGTDQWGWDSDLATEVDVAPTMAPLVVTPSIEGASVVKEPIVNTIVITTAVGKDFVKAPIVNTVDLTEDLESVMRGSGIWDYVFTRPTTDGDQKVFDEFARVGDGGDDFNKVPDPSTSWERV